MAREGRPVTKPSVTMTDNKPETPVVLPEHIPPDHSRSCNLCELSTHGTRLIWGEGNPGAPVFVILDNPGAREDKSGRPFLCGTRETLQKAAYEIGFRREQLYITYILKCRPRRAYDKPVARITCIEYLWTQLESANPTVVFCLGNVACQALFENPNVQVKHLRGVPHHVKGFNVVTSYHPLAVRRRPALYKYFLADWKLVAQYALD